MAGGGLLRKWGIGAELVFSAGGAIREMTRTSRTVGALRQSFQALKSGMVGIGFGLGQIALALTPLGIGFGALLAKSSALGANLESQLLTFRVLLGSAEKAEALISDIRKTAASTPFQEGDLIEGSKRLLRLSKDNVTENKRLLGIAMTMSALNPTKGITDSVEAMLDAASGGGFERLKEFGLAFRAEDFKDLGRPGGEAWAAGIMEALQAELTKMTRGEDLVGALAGTFSGRLSTLKDQVLQTLTEIGMGINERIGPHVDDLIDRISGMKDEIVEAFDRLATEVENIYTTRIEPVLTSLTEWWDGLGSEARIGVLAGVAAVGALAAGLLSLGAVAGIAGLLLGGIVTLVGGIVTVISGLSVEAVVVVGAVLLAAAAAVAIFFGSFKREGESAWGFIARMGGALWGVLGEVWGAIQAAYEPFAQGFLKEFLPVLNHAIATMGPDVRALVRDVADLVGWLWFGGMGDGAADVWATLGRVIGGVLGYSLYYAALGVRLVVGGLRGIWTIIQPLILLLAEFGKAWVDVFTGASTAGEGLKRTIDLLMVAVVAMALSIFSTMLWFVENTLRMVETVIRAIPGANLLFGDVSLGADSLAGMRDELADTLERGIIGIDLADSRKRRNQADAFSPSLNLTLPEPAITAKVESRVCVDGEDIGRATGDVKVRQGEKGQGPPMPAEARGRVLRGGLEVTQLRPSEVF